MTTLSKIFVVVATAAMHKQFEAFIRRAPEQWMWAHRKWV